jgi:hypothetical protein
VAGPQRYPCTSSLRTHGRAQEGLEPAGSWRRLALINSRESRTFLARVTPPLAAGGPELWREFMAELRTIHLGEPAPEGDDPSVMERLAKAYAAAL